MPKHKLLVFIGKPGVGKTTLIKKEFSKTKFYDVKPYIIPHVGDGKWPEEKTLDCYKKMYQDINKEEEDIVLEIGTNHAEFNIAELESLQQRFRLVIIICILPIEENKKRYIGRDEIIDMEAFEKRLHKDFPNSHMDLVKKSGIPYFTLDMQPTTEEIIEIFKAEMTRLNKK